MKRRKDIPAPLYISKQPGEEKLDIPNQHIMVPMALADAPRIFLDFLARHSNISDAYRNKISEWILTYNQHIVAYILGTYGPAGLVAADATANEMAAQFLQVVEDDYKQAEGDLFARLEDEIGGNGSV